MVANPSPTGVSSRQRTGRAAGTSDDVTVRGSSDEDASARAPPSNTIDDGRSEG